MLKGLRAPANFCELLARRTPHLLSCLPDRSRATTFCSHSPANSLYEDVVGLDHEDPVPPGVTRVQPLLDGPRSTRYWVVTPGAPRCPPSGCHSFSYESDCCSAKPSQFKCYPAQSNSWSCAAPAQQPDSQAYQLSQVGSRGSTRTCQGQPLPCPCIRWVLHAVVSNCRIGWPSPSKLLITAASTFACEIDGISKTAYRGNFVHDSIRVHSVQHPCKILEVTARGICNLCCPRERLPRLRQCRMWGS